MISLVNSRHPCGCASAKIEKKNHQIQLEKAGIFVDAERKKITSGKKFFNGLQTKISIKQSHSLQYQYSSESTLCSIDTCVVSALCNINTVRYQYSAESTLCSFNTVYYHN